jgi:hypothetical protein
MTMRLIALVLLLAATPAGVHAGATTPTLILATGAVLGDAGSPRTAVFGATFDHTNAVQADYDLELVVWQGRRFARFPISGATRTGESAALDDGLAAADLPALDAAGAAASAVVRLVALGTDAMTVTLPDTFAAGSATAALVATVDEGVVLSNPLSFVLP